MTGFGVDEDDESLVIEKFPPYVAFSFCCTDFSVFYDYFMTMYVYPQYFQCTKKFDFKYEEFYLNTW